MGSDLEFDIFRFLPIWPALDFNLDLLPKPSILSPMARPLRMQIAGGRYHVTARGNEQRDIFRQDRDRFHFLELLTEWPSRFGIRLHAYVLMDNHYHLVVETPEPNLSRALHWLNVS
jgi:putative transposase